MHTGSCTVFTSKENERRAQPLMGLDVEWLRCKILLAFVGFRLSILPCLSALLGSPPLSRFAFRWRRSNRSTRHLRLCFIGPRFLSASVVLVLVAKCRWRNCLAGVLPG